MPSNRVWQMLLIGTTVGLAWYLMMAVHELGHVLHASLSGGDVQQVVLRPLSISRTDISPNPHPQFVAWGGAIWGVTIPLALLMFAGLLVPKWKFLFAFFAGFCCLANGLYLGVGAVYPVGDAADLLRHGASRWQLAAFGLPMCILGFWPWNGLGGDFGLASSHGNVDRRAAIATAILFCCVLALMTGLSPR